MYIYIQRTRAHKKHLCTTSINTKSKTGYRLFEGAIIARVCTCTTIEASAIRERISLGG